MEVVRASTTSSAMEDAAAVIVGAGPSGLATAACLNQFAIPNIILEKEDCAASLWKRRTYDRLKLHLAKEFCELPHMPHPADAPTFIPKEDFISYLDDYVAKFNIMAVLYSTKVELATFDEAARSWTISARDAATGQAREYRTRFLVVATGENADGFIPDVPGLKTFPGEVLHSSAYKSGAASAGKRVLVVGSGNSGMEIAYDLANYGANVSISIRSPLNVMTKEMVRLGMGLAKYLPLGMLDSLTLMLSWLWYGDLSKYGIRKPKLGPLANKVATGRSAVIDVGTISKIKTGEIQVVKGLVSVTGDEVLFSDSQAHQFDAIVFATGYRSTANTWLKDGGRLLNEDGSPVNRFPGHWKGGDGIYCAGFGRQGLAGVSKDAQNIANDIKKSYTGSEAAN